MPRLPERPAWTRASVLFRRSRASEAFSSSTKFGSAQTTAPCGSRFRVQPRRAPWSTLQHHGVLTRTLQCSGVPCAPERPALCIVVRPMAPGRQSPSGTCRTSPATVRIAAWGSSTSRGAGFCASQATAPGPPMPHLHRDWTHPMPHTSAPGLGACRERALLQIAGDRASEHARTRGSASARAHTHAHTTHMRAHMLARMLTDTHTHTHTSTCSHTCSHAFHTHARARTLACAHAHLRGHRCTHTTYERARTAPMPLTRNCANTRAAHALCFALLCFALRCVGLRGGCAALPTVAQATSLPAPEASNSCAGSPPRPAFAAQLTLDQGLVFRSGAPAFFWVGS